MPAAYGDAGAEVRFGLFSHCSRNDFSSLTGMRVSALPEPTSKALLLAGMGLRVAMRVRADRDNDSA